MDKLSLTSKRLLIAGIMVGFAAVVALVLRDAGAPAAPAGAHTVATTAAAKAPRSAPSISLPGHSIIDDGDDLMSMDDEVTESIVKKDKKLETFMRYYKAVVPDDQTRREYHKFLSDSATMKAMAEDLMDPGSGHPQSTEYYRRLMLVDYFEAALDWKDNPQRQNLIALTQDIITRDNFRGDQDTERRQVLGGTKMELYRLLVAQDPQRAGELIAQAKGTRMEPLVTWMTEEEIHRRTREAEIIKEAESEVRRD
jgi:hypothetical protein